MIEMSDAQKTISPGKCFYIVICARFLFFLMVNEMDWKNALPVRSVDTVIIQKFRFTHTFIYL